MGYLYYRISLQKFSDLCAQKSNKQLHFNSKNNTNNKVNTVSRGKFNGTTGQTNKAHRLGVRSKEYEVERKEETGKERANSICSTFAKSYLWHV